MDKTLGRIAFEVWMYGPVSDEHWNEKPGYLREQWESIAAAVAAEVRKECDWRPIEEAPENKWLFVGKYGVLGWVVGLNVKNLAADNRFTHYLPQPEPPPQETKA